MRICGDTHGQFGDVLRLFQAVSANSRSSGRPGPAFPGSLNHGPCRAASRPPRTTCSSFHYPVVPISLFYTIWSFLNPGSPQFPALAGWLPARLQLPVPRRLRGPRPAEPGDGPHAHVLQGTPISRLLALFSVMREFLTPGSRIFLLFGSVPHVLLGSKMNIPSFPRSEINKLLCQRSNIKKLFMCAKDQRSRNHLCKRSKIKILSLSIFQLMFPANLFLLRGNHECARINKVAYFIVPDIRQITGTDNSQPSLKPGPRRCTASTRSACSATHRASGRPSRLIFDH